LFDEMAAKPPADPLKGHDRYKKIKDLNQGKEREARTSRGGDGTVFGRDI
jgi:hypothetical protein